jgi:hypothetical protein
VIAFSLPAKGRVLVAEGSILAAVACFHAPDRSFRGAENFILRAIESFHGVAGFNRGGVDGLLAANGFYRLAEDFFRGCTGCFRQVAASGVGP